MNRSKVIFLSVFIMFLTITACIWSASPSPTGLPFPDDNFIHTSVAQTLTVLALPTITPSPAAVSTQTANPAAQTPKDFIFYYFANINSRNYPLTWSLLTDRFKNNLNGTSQGGYQGYMAFWNSVNRVYVKNVFFICDGDICAVDATLQLNYTNGQVDTSTYAYTVIYDHGLNSWMFDFIPAPTATASRTFTATRTRTATSTATRTRTPTTTATKTSTSTTTATKTNTAVLSQTPATMTASPTQTASATPSQTPSSGVTPTSSPTFTPTSTLPPVTSTPTASPSRTPTPTLSPVATGTETPTWTPSETPTPTSIGT